MTHAGGTNVGGSVAAGHGGMGIPAPPREVRWRPCLAHYWVLGLVGGLVAIDGLILIIVLNAVGVPEMVQTIMIAITGAGAATLGYWYRSVLKLRLMLRDGFLARGQVEEAKRFSAMNPPHVRLRYRFTDEQGIKHRGKQFVRAGSVLGKRLAAASEGAEVPVIYEPYDPRMCRVVGPEDFLATTGLETTGEPR